MALQLFRKSVFGSLKFFNKVSNRAIMTSTFDLDKVQEELEKNPYYEKYASKIEALKKANPQEFESRLKEVEDKKQPKKVKTERKRKTSLTKLTKPKKLDDIMKMELIEGQSTQEIGRIWCEFHKGKDCVANVITRDVYSIMRDRCVKYPTFVHPVPKDKGYEFYMSFFEEDAAHFTPLRKYKELKENSPECLEIHYYTELMDSKNIVLIRGTYDTDELTALEANCLASSLQLYYSELEGKRANSLQSFTETPEEFQHMDLIADFEAYSAPKSL